MFRRWLHLPMVAALLLAVLGHAQAPAPGLGEIQAPLVGVRNLGKGQLICLLYQKVDRVDADVRKAWRVQTVRPTARDLLIRFEAVPAGEYAVAVFHDMDGDGKLTTNFLGVPQEDLAISRNAKGGPLGGPTWVDVKVQVSGRVLQLQPMVMRLLYD
ncbi:MAG: DUF2141 domain-containing protein [Deltaproteobacteria bacterium]|nr:DUF2141 domain-containing protein [Deltaproteobacteria bacterium]